MRRDRLAIFLDRDGTIIEDVGYPRDPTQVRLCIGAAEALAELQRQGFCLIVVSNQSGIGRGLIAPAEAEAVHRRFLTTLGERGVRLEASYYCPHAPQEGCTCRKPSPSLLLRAAAELGVDLERSFMIGDKATDVEAGKRAECRTILLRPNSNDSPCHSSADWTVESWPAAVAEIQRNFKGSA